MSFKQNMCVLVTGLICDCQQQVTRCKSISYSCLKIDRLIHLFRELSCFRIPMSPQMLIALFVDIYDTFLLKCICTGIRKRLNHYKIQFNNNDEEWTNPFSGFVHVIFIWDFGDVIKDKAFLITIFILRSTSISH